MKEGDNAEWTASDTNWRGGGIENGTYPI